MKPSTLAIWTVALAASMAYFGYTAARLVGFVAVVNAQVSGQNIADEETPGGVPDGTLQFFTLRQVPVVLSTKLYRNGLRQTRGVDYAVYPSTKRIGFFPCCLPQAGDVLRIDYRW